MHNTVTTDEANRLATGLTGAAAAERDEPFAVREVPYERTFVGSIDVHLRPDAPVTARRYASLPDTCYVTIGPVHLHGAEHVLEAALGAALEAVRVARTGPVGA